MLTMTESGFRILRFERYAVVMGLFVVCPNKPITCTKPHLQSACHAKDAYYKAKNWAKQHHLCMPQVPLPQPLLDIVNEWFCLVDDDGSGSLSAAELKMAFTVCFPSTSYTHLCLHWGGCIMASPTSLPLLRYHC